MSWHRQPVGASLCWQGTLYPSINTGPLTGNPHKPLAWKLSLAVVLGQVPDLHLVLVQRCRNFALIHVQIRFAGCQTVH